MVPLEFISSIYEEFVTAKGAHYTPGYLVDFMLDEVLPWGSDQWDLKILDPACGSGIFLVKAYQRLIQRWKNAHPDQKPAADDLRRILQRNLFGVDIDPHAVRVASFSLYLTMCDELDPKSYLNSTKFPPLRDQTLICADFFREDVPGFSTAKDAETYNLVVGNAPWGKGTATELAQTWARNPSPLMADPEQGLSERCFWRKRRRWPSADGRVSMIQPASSLLFNRSGPARSFREKLFSTFKVEQIVNLSTLRFELFEDVASPPCIVTLRPTEPDDAATCLYFAETDQARRGCGSNRQPIHDCHRAARHFANLARRGDCRATRMDRLGLGRTARPCAWCERLSTESNLEKMRKAGSVKSREGLIRGDQRTDTAGNRRPKDS